ncbi:hypothetical protein [Floridanema evergladense]|uniref:Uncharacterized protein n=1 Tax=Floridaenema evergladense BLCC-F167 TaxID=3153639 RepID=A0ABV4WHB6_9CYAN
MTEENRIIIQMLANWDLPNSGWQYWEIYGHCQEVRKSLERLANFMVQIEKATPEADRAIKEDLDQIVQQLNQTRRLMDN